MEGAGGWQVPLSPSLRIADLALALQLPVVLVVGMRLGCINHALLTADAIRASGLQLAGWIASHVDPHMLEPEANMNYLRAHIGAPCWLISHGRRSLMPAPSLCIYPRSGHASLNA